MENEQKTLLKIKHVDVKFRVRGRILSAIRDANLEIKEHETIAIVGESGSGKSVLTKTFAGMLDSNGYISHGNVYFYDDEISYTETRLSGRNKWFRDFFLKKMREYSYESAGATEYLAIEALKKEIEQAKTLPEEAHEDFAKREKELIDNRNDTFNARATLNRRSKEDHDKFIEATAKLKELDAAIKALAQERKDLIKNTRLSYLQNAELRAQHEQKLKQLEETRTAKIEAAKQNPLTEEQEKNALEIANEIILSVGRYPFHLFFRYAFALWQGFHIAYCRGRDLSTEKQRRRVFEPIVFRVEYQKTIEKETSQLKTTIDEDFSKYLAMPVIEAEILGNDTLLDQARALHPHLRKSLIKKFKKASQQNGYTSQADDDNCVKLADLILLRVARYDSAIHANCMASKIAKWIVNAFNTKKADLSSSTIPAKPATTLVGYAYIDCAKVKYLKDWEKIRGCRIATVFQDPMTSLNPILTIGKQISMVIMKHQKVSAFEAKRQAIEIMHKVGIPNPEKRFDDYPFQYSGGMRQRIVIAIALSCQPKILICDEPTTALDVTIQAQIIRLIKKLSKDLGFTTVYITHDLGVVANVADRVAVLYGGQIVELGTVEDVFYEPAHPYTWALLGSMPQLGTRGEELFSIPGTPPSLYNKIVGDAFAPRSQYAMAIDFVKEPPAFEINDHHWAKTWLLDPRAPKVERPKSIQNLHAKMSAIYAEKEEK